MTDNVASIRARQRHHATRVPVVPSAQTPIHRGVLLGSGVLFLHASASAVTYPFLQTRRDALGCDALCQGGQASLRSGLTLLGAMLVGRLSDSYGRIRMLWLGSAASLLSLAINGSMDSIEGMWWAIVPAALLSHNFAVSKALFSDYIDERRGPDADKAGAVGKLGMAVGFSYMVGPLFSSLLVSEYIHALQLSAVIMLFSAGCVLALPTPTGGSLGLKKSPPAGLKGQLMGFISLPVLKTPGGQVPRLTNPRLAARPRLATWLQAPGWLHAGYMCRHR